MEGYIELFGSCSTTADVYDILKSQISHVNGIMGLIKHMLYVDKSKFVKTLLDFNGEVEQSLDKKNPEKYLQRMETFSLLENIFRNAVLRPYIPAYRVINKKCSRYSYCLENIAEKLFKDLKFKNNDDSFIYTEADPLIAVYSSLACASLWYHISSSYKHPYSPYQSTAV